MLAQLTQAMAGETGNTRTAIRITARPERVDAPEYPKQAYRKALVNAIVHRVYTSAGKVQVRIYSGRLEVWSPVSLLSGITLDSLYCMHMLHGPGTANSRTPCTGWESLSAWARDTVNCERSRGA